MAAARAIRVVGLSKAYDGHLVLRGLELEVEEGEFVSITGPSGCGKTTLLNIVGGLDRDYSGTVEVFGQDLGTLGDAALARLRRTGIGFVFQSFQLLGHLSCRENVALPWFFSDDTIDRRSALRRADEVLERVGLGSKKDTLPAHLSGGQRQRVAIARALFGRPRLILSDEATGNLDADTAQKVTNLYVSLNRQEGITFVVVTHRERAADAVGRVLRLEEGRLVPAGAPLHAEASDTPGGPR